MNKQSERFPNLERARDATAAEVIDRVLDKGIVIEYRLTGVFLSGIDVPVTNKSRVIISSLDTYLASAEPSASPGSSRMRESTSRRPHRRTPEPRRHG